MPGDSNEALRTAAINGKLDDMRRAVAAGGDINAKDNYGRTAAMLAAEHGHRECLEYAVTAGCDINAKTKQGETAAMYAAFSGHLPCLKCAVIAGGDINAKDNDGETAAMFAALHGHLPCLEYAVTAGGDINAKTKNGHTAAMMAALNGHLPCLEYAVTAGGDITAKDYTGSTAALMAAINGHSECREYAVAAGGGINAKSNTRTAAMRAASNGHTTTAEWLESDEARELARVAAEGADDRASPSSEAVATAGSGHASPGSTLSSQAPASRVAPPSAPASGLGVGVAWLSAASSPGSSGDERKESGPAVEEVARLRAAMAAKEAEMRAMQARLAANETAMRAKEAEMVELQVLLTCRMKHFEVLRAVGGGQNGMVFAVRCLREGIPRAAKEYALKMVFNFGNTSTAGRNLYEAEYAVQSQLPPHRHLLRFWAEFYDPIPDAMMPHLPEFARSQAEYRIRRSGEMVRRRTQFIVTDCHPETLESKLAGLALPLPYATAVKYTAQLLRGVAHMHKHRVAHLDLKLDNILVADDSRLVICDFGTAQRFRSEDMTVRYSHGMPVGGNQLHLAPEVLNAFNAAQRGHSEEGVCYAKQAMWAVGSLVHEMVLGSPPFPDYPNAYRRGGYRVSVEGEEVAELPEAYPEAFKALVRSMLQGEAAKRCECEAALAVVEALAK